MMPKALQFTVSGDLTTPKERRRQGVKFEFPKAETFSAGWLEGFLADFLPVERR